MGEAHHVGAFEVLVRKGEPIEGLMIIKQGEALCCSDVDGNLVPLYRVKKGDFIGPESLFLKSSHIHHVVSLTEVVFTVLEKQEIYDYLNSVNHWYSDTMKTLGQRIWDTEKIITEQRLEHEKLSGGEIAADKLVKVRKALGL